MREERLSLSDILVCIQRIESYTSGGRETFIQSQLIQDAVVRNFEIIGEATKQVSAELRQLILGSPGKKLLVCEMC